MRSALCIWFCVTLPAGAALDPDPGQRVELDAPAEEFERVTVPCLDEGHDQRMVTWFIVDKAGSRRGEGRQVVRYRC